VRTDDVRRFGPAGPHRTDVPPVPGVDRPDERVARVPAHQPEHRRLLHLGGRSLPGEREPGAACLCCGVLRRRVRRADEDHLQGADRELGERGLPAGGQGTQESPPHSGRPAADRVPDPVGRAVLSALVRVHHPAPALRLVDGRAHHPDDDRPVCPRVRPAPAVREQGERMASRNGAGAHILCLQSSVREGETERTP
jgi:hypothetical protein